MGTPHRKTVRHFDVPGHAHELTFSTYQRRSLLTSAAVVEVVLQGIERARARGLFQLVAFVVMPEHIHMLIRPSIRGEAATPVSKILYAIKKPTSARIKKSIASNPPLLESLTIQERRGKTAFRFWQEGGGYDRNIVSEKAFWNSVEYIHMNPVRRGLCERPEGWEWSSASQWEEPGAGLPGSMPRVDWREGLLRLDGDC